MHILSVLSIIASIIYILIGTNIYRLNKRSNVGTMFFMLTMSLAIWSFAFSFDYYAPNSVISSLWKVIVAVGWSFFPALIFLLVVALTEMKQYNKELILLIALPGMISFIMAVILNFHLLPVSYFFYQVFYRGNDLYNISYIILSLYFLVKWGRNSTCTVHKKQAGIIAVSSIITFLIYFTTEIMLKQLDIIHLPNITHIYCIIMISGIYYSTIKYNFLLVSNTLINNELFDGIMDLTFLVDLKGKIIRANSQVYHTLEYHIEDFINTKITDIIRDEEFQNIIQNIDSICESQKIYNSTIATKRGRAIPFHITISPLRGSVNQLILGYIVIGQDIRVINQLKNEIMEHEMTAERLTLSEELFRTVAVTIPFSILFTKRRDHTIFYVNENAIKLFKIDYETFIGYEAENLYENPKDRNELINKFISQGKLPEQEVTFKKSNGEIFTGTITMVPAFYNGEEVILSCIADITERKKAEDILTKNREEIEKINRKLTSSYNLLKEKSIRDGLTGLYNHQYIIELLEIEMKKVYKTRNDLCLMMLDIDHFKNVNDTYGHQTGDMVLNKVASIITENVRETDYAGRYGGEEFMVILPFLSLEKAILVAERIRLKIQNYTYPIDGLRVTISIGLTDFEGDDPVSFISKADKLLYLAKENGRNRLETNKEAET